MKTVYLFTMLSTLMTLKVTVEGSSQAVILRNTLVATAQRSAAGTKRPPKRSGGFKRV